MRRKTADHFKFKVGDIIKYIPDGSFFKITKHHVPTNGMPTFLYYSRSFPIRRNELIGADSREWVESNCELHYSNENKKKAKKALGL